MMQRTDWFGADWVETTWERRWWYRATAAFVVLLVSWSALVTKAWGGIPVVSICAGLVWLYPIIMRDARDLGRQQGRGDEDGFMVVPETCPLCGRYLSVVCSRHDVVCEP